MVYCIVFKEQKVKYEELFSVSPWSFLCCSAVQSLDPALGSLSAEAVNLVWAGSFFLVKHIMVVPVYKLVLYGQGWGISSLWKALE